nr:hypothetical protein [Pseudoteredinibacter isoporae]
MAQPRRQGEAADVIPGKHLNRNGGDAIGNVNAAEIVADKGP